MAEGAFVVYQHALEDIASGALDLSSATCMLALCSAAYTPSPQSDSSWTVDISTFEVTETNYAAAKLLNNNLSRVDNSTVRFDVDDATHSAQTVMDAKWGVVYMETSGRPLCYYDLSAGAASGVEATKITHAFNANGLFEFSNPN